MRTIADLLNEGERILADAGVADPRRDAASLATMALGRDRTFLYAYPEHEVDAVVTVKIREFLRRRANREPLQYIRGSQEFYGLDFEVTPDVLIPRPETEILVEFAIDLIRGLEEPRFLDIGTGSGCVPVSILVHVPKAQAISVDISPAAMEVARRNARRHGVADRLELIESDIYAKVPMAGFHLIVSNPPYVPREDISGLQPEVRDHEPRLALTDGADGLSIIREIARRASEFLLPGGHLLVEIGLNQSEHVRAMMSADMWINVRLERDLQGIPRVLTAKRR